MAHKFKLRQQVRLVSGGAGSGGTWEIVRLLPEDERGERSYRVAAAGVERAVRESDIEPA
jgi:hypothetical protein